MSRRCLDTLEDLFSTVDDLLEKDKLPKDDQDWLEKELEEREQKLKAHKKKDEGKVKAV